MIVLSVSAEPVPLRKDADSIYRVGATRVTLDTLIEAFHEGATVEEMVQQYPSLIDADIYTVLGYYLRHQPEVDAYLKERGQQKQQVRLQNEQRFDPNGIRERLSARRNKQP